MDQGFIGILRTIIKEHGKAAIMETAKCKALLADYTKGEYKIESRLLFQALDAKVQKAIDKTQEIDICRKQQVRVLHEEYLLIEEHAKDIVDTLVLVLKNIEKEKNLCKKCGKELPDDWKACPYCGELVKAVTPLLYTEPSSPVKPSQHSKPLVINGNTPGNIVNHGLTAFQDGWLYFINSKDGDKIYKMQIDGTKGFNDSVKVNDDKCSFLNIADGWLYYQNRSDGEAIYKIRTDGTERQKLNNNPSKFINLTDDWIYYLTEENDIYKITINGTDNQWLKKSNKQAMEFICPLGAWIYYQNEDDGEKLYKMRADGTDRQALNNDRSYYINADGDWVYYQNASDGGKIYKIKTDGTERVKLCNDRGGFINITGDWIFYINFDDGFNLYRIRKDSADRHIVQ